MLGDPDDAEDITQEVCVKIYQNLGSLRNKSKIAGWVFIIIKNAIFDFKRAKIRDFKEYKAYIDEERARIKNYLSDVYTSDLTDLDFTLSTLSEKEKIVFMLRALDDMKYAEIVEILKHIYGKKHSESHARWIFNNAKEKARAENSEL
jgi:RNA polymerase sigma-70 factor (ECF subfamily)